MDAGLFGAGIFTFGIGFLLGLVLVTNAGKKDDAVKHACHRLENVILQPSVVPNDIARYEALHCAAD